MDARASRQKGGYLRTHLIASDFQVPYQDPHAVEIFLQIGQHIKPDTLVLNGDFGDWRVISGKYPVRSDSTRCIVELREEVRRQRELLQTIVKEIKPKHKLWNDGNHEWRIFRSMSQMPNVLRLLELETVCTSLSVPSLLDLGKLNFKYAGEYPHGQWLTGALDHGKDVWLEHGYLVRNKAGYLAQALIEKRMSNVITGHCERLAITWRNAVGGRSFFGAEGGNMSILGVPGKGDGIYSSSPLNVADYRDSQQGFMVLYEDGGEFYPYPVRIVNNRAVWNGKLYRG